MTNFFYCIRSLLLLACVPLLLSAQEDAMEFTHPARNITAMIVNDGRFDDRYYGNEDAGIAGVEAVQLYILSADRAEPISVPFGGLSSTVRYRGPRRLVFYHNPPSADPEAAQPSIAATTELPEGRGDLMLLFFTEDFDRRTYRVLPIDVSGDNFPINSLRIMNMSPFDIAWQISGERGRINRNGAEIVDLDPEEPFQKLQMVRYDTEGDKWRTIYSRHLQIIDGYRSTFLVLPRPGTEQNRVMIKVMNDDYRRRMREIRALEEKEREEAEEAAAAKRR